MKFGILKDRNQFGHRGGDQTYTHLLLENSEDVYLYNEILANKNAETNVNLLFGFKSQNFTDTLYNYAIHQNSQMSTETKLLLHKLNNKDTRTDILEYCKMSDDIVSDKVLKILEHIESGKIIRINMVGGYCFVSDTMYADYDEIIDAEYEQIYSFIHFGKIDFERFSITKNTVVIENDNCLSTDFVKLLLNYSADFDVLYNFRNVIRTYTNTEIVELFVNATKNGLINICFETTGQDLHQLRKMCLLLQKVQEITHINYNLYIKTYNKEVYEIFKSFNIIKL